MSVSFENSVKLYFLESCHSYHFTPRLFKQAVYKYNMVLVIDNVHVVCQLPITSGANIDCQLKQTMFYM